MDPEHANLALKGNCAETLAKLEALFDSDSSIPPAATQDPPGPVSPPAAAPPPKKAARHIDEDDYGDDEDEEDEDPAKDTPLKQKGKSALPNGLSPFAVRSPVNSGKPPISRATTSAPSEPAKSSEDVRKQLEEDKKAAADAAKASFQSMFFTFESDRDAMMEQQKLDDLDREVENEISGGPNGTHGAQQGTNGVAGALNTQGTLGSADLGASSLTLKHLIARIDMKRDMVRASDNHLRTLISEVRKGRSKWASEDRVGQEELYEASEKVLMELKAMTEYAQPFLQRVSKREAPDYYNVITKPMDIGTMLKKLKSLSYKSKKDFVDDLSLIWTNCLKYNQDPAHPLRKKALYMRKETDKLTPLIPEIVVRDRAEVEAEERRMHNIDADDSDEDDAPIMASRGRKAPKKGSKGVNGGSTKRAPTVAVNGDSGLTPAPEAKPGLHAGASSLRNEFLRADSEMQDVSSQGFNTPPPGTTTPMVNGVNGNGATGSQADVMEVDGLGNSMLGSAQDDADEDDTEFKAWKQVTKSDRAQAAGERHRLFRGDQLKNLNLEEPALLRNRAMMRRWMRQQKESSAKTATETDTQEGDEANGQSAQGESLAEGIEKDEESTLPDYYGSLSAIPELDEKWKWATDSEGYVVPRAEEWMRMYPRETFQSTKGALTTRMDANIRQMQQTRQICGKIGIVKQMQLQAQTYQNQFQKYEPKPFTEIDCGPAVVSEAGPIMAPWLSRHTLQRAVSKIFYHAGFEDFQPSALDAVTDVTSQYMQRLVETFKSYNEQPKQESTSGAPSERHTSEEQVLHTLLEHGSDLESMETYVKDDVERLATKLGVVHERMKSHLADLLRPALGDNAGADGVGAFNDGSEQFVGGDFADELGEDFFGFRELGLADELGLDNLAVPLHLLQNRMHSAYQAQNQGPVAGTYVQTFEPPARYESVTVENVGRQVGIVQDFFREKLRRNHDEALVEDEELPQKQRFPKPRLPPTGKISSPRKRPIREQQQAAKKKRKQEEAQQGGEKLVQPIGKLKFDVPKPVQEEEEPEKRARGEREDGAMISPESITAN